jgi:hypothetical protein
MPATALATCEVYGTIYDVFGQPAAGATIGVMAVYKNNALILAKTKEVQTDIDGYFTMDLPRDSVAVLYANAPGLNISCLGTPTAIPDADSAELTTIISDVDLWTEVPVAVPIGAGVSSFNGRRGDVVLLASDVTGALGYTPADSAALAGYLLLAGGTMTGLLTLSGDPTLPLHAATRQWVLAQIGAIPAGGVTSFNSRTGAVVPLVGDYAAFYAAISHTHTRAQITDLGVFSTAQPGLVPQPTAGDAAKFLTGAGTWAAAAAGVDTAANYTWTGQHTHNNTVRFNNPVGFNVAPAPGIAVYAVSYLPNIALEFGNNSDAAAYLTVSAPGSTGNTYGRSYIISYGGFAIANYPLSGIGGSEPELMLRCSYRDNPEKRSTTIYGYQGDNNVFFKTVLSDGTTIRMQQHVNGFLGINGPYTANFGITNNCTNFGMNGGYLLNNTQSGWQGGMSFYFADTALQLWSTGPVELVGQGSWNGAPTVKVYSDRMTVGVPFASNARLEFGKGDTSITHSFQLGDSPAASLQYKLPNASPTANQVLQASAPASGVVILSWATPASGGGGGSPAGTGTEIQYRSGASAFGAISGSSVSGANVTFGGGVQFNQRIGLNIAPNSGYQCNVQTSLPDVSFAFTNGIDASCNFGIRPGGAGAVSYLIYYGDFVISDFSTSFATEPIWVLRCTGKNTGSNFHSVDVYGYSTEGVPFFRCVVDGGMPVFTVHTSGAVRLWDGASLQQIKIGAAGSGPGGSGRMLYID